MIDKKNNKGFSLVEILATIVILAIVSTVGIVSINKMITKSRQHFYESQKQQMVLATQSYVNDNRNILPKNVGGMNKVKLATLREKNYLKEDIVDQDKNPCDKEKSYVTIYKSNRSDYKYRGYLECPACKSGGSAGTNECYSDSDKLKPAIEIELAKPNDVNKENNLMKADHKIKINIKATDNPTENPEIKVASYSYKIYVNNVLKTDSGTKIDNKRQDFSIVEKLNKYVPGKVKVVATVTNTDGSTTSKTATEDYSDYTNPSCGVVSYEGANLMDSYHSQTKPAPKCGESGYSWINISTPNDNRVVWVVCNDVEGIGCAQHEFSQSFNTDGHDDKIIIKDKFGNYDAENNGCTVKKCIDRTTSKITLDIYKADENGKASGSSVHTFTAPAQSTDSNYYKEDEYKVWLNNNDFPNGVLVKVKVDEPTSKINKFTWKINPKEQSLDNVTDANTPIKTKSDLEDNEVTYLIEEDGVRKQDITVEDNAGNIVRYVVTLWIDRTAPPVPTVSMFKEENTSSTATSTTYTSNYWTSKYVWASSDTPTDKPNVSGWIKNQFKTSGAHGTLDKQDGTNTHIDEEGISYINFRSCDVAGNCSNYTEDSIIKEDRTKPTFTLSVSSDKTSYHTKKVNASFTPSDSLSGSKEYCISTSECTPGTALTEGVKVSTSITPFSDYNGSSSKIYVCVKDKVGNKKCHNESYTVYDYCDDKENDGDTYCGSYGDCNCSKGKKYANKYQKKQDKHFNSHKCGKVDAGTCSKSCSCPSSGGGDGGGGGGDDGGSSSTPHGCFLAGTKVNTPNGPVSIEDIRPGDRVLSYNEHTRKNEYHSVKHLFTFKDLNEELYTITLDDNTKFKVTSKHTIYTSFDKKLFRYIKAESLSDKNYLMYSDGTIHKIVDIQGEDLYGTVYNLEVNQTHNFYIGDQQILVHNTRRIKKFDIPAHAK